jgi:hypothetical protein
VRLIRDLPEITSGAMASHSHLIQVHLKFLLETRVRNAWRQHSLNVTRRSLPPHPCSPPPTSCKDVFHSQRVSWREVVVLGADMREKCVGDLWPPRTYACATVCRLTFQAQRSTLKTFKRWRFNVWIVVRVEQRWVYLIVGN